MATKTLPPIPKHRTESKAKPAPAPVAPAGAAVEDGDPYGPLSATRCPSCGSIDDDRHVYFGADWHHASDMRLDATVRRLTPEPAAEMICLECEHRGTIQDFYDSWTAASAWDPDEASEPDRPAAPRLAVVASPPGDPVADDDEPEAEPEDEAEEDDSAPIALDEDDGLLSDGDDVDSDAYDLDHEDDYTGD